MIKLMIGVLILACGSTFFINGPDGKPLMTMDEFLSRSTPSSAVNNKDIEPTKVYKWQDEHGVWQFSNTPVAEHETEIVMLDGQINTMDAYVAPKKVEKAGASSAFSALPPGLTTVSPDKIGEMMDTVNSLQDTLDQRKVEIDRNSRAN